MGFAPGAGCCAVTCTWPPHGDADCARCAVMGACLALMPAPGGVRRWGAGVPPMWLPDWPALAVIADFLTERGMWGEVHGWRPAEATAWPRLEYGVGTIYTPGKNMEPV